MTRLAPAKNATETRDDRVPPRGPLAAFPRQVPKLFRRLFLNREEISVWEYWHQTFDATPNRRALLAPLDHTERSMLERLKDAGCFQAVENGQVDALLERILLGIRVTTIRDRPQQTEKRRVIAMLQALTSGEFRLDQGNVKRDFQLWLHERFPELMPDQHTLTERVFHYDYSGNGNGFGALMKLAPRGPYYLGVWGFLPWTFVAEEDMK